MNPSASLFVLAVVLAGAMSACDTETPTTAAVENGYPTLADGGDPATQTVVLRVWFATTLFSDPVLPGVTSGGERTVPTSDVVYAVVAPGWDPTSGSPPPRLVALRSKGALAVARGDLGLIVVSPNTFDGDCAADSHLSQDDADIVTQRVFPGTFAGLLYDAATCTTRRAEGDGGVEGGLADAGSE